MDQGVLVGQNLGRAIARKKIWNCFAMDAVQVGIGFAALLAAVLSIAWASNSCLRRLVVYAAFF